MCIYIIYIMYIYYIYYVYIYICIYIICFAKYSNFAILRKLFEFREIYYCSSFRDIYFAKQTIYSDSPDHVRQSDIHHI